MIPEIEDTAMYGKKWGVATFYDRTATATNSR